MTVKDLLAACDTIEGIRAGMGLDVGCARVTLVLDRPPGRGRRMRVAPGLMGELVAVNPAGEAVVQCLTRDVRRAARRWAERW